MAWAFRDGGYELRFNRDENWARPVSADPSFEMDHPVPGACARDLAATGTWLFTNENGLTLAVLNAYPAARIPIPGRRSRGLIPLIAASARTVEEVESSLEELEREDFSPFEAVLVAQDQIRRYAWDGELFSRLPVPDRNFLTTSSVDGERVRLERNARFDVLCYSFISTALNDSFFSTSPSSAIYVTREDGGTVSQTCVLVRSNHIYFSVQRRGGALQELNFARLP